MPIHPCQYKGCIHEAFEACQSPKGCGAWLCPDHIRNHSCDEVGFWLGESPSLNAVPGLSPGQVGQLDEDWKEKLR